MPAGWIDEQIAPDGGHAAADLCEACAGPFEDGDDAYRSGRYTEAFEKLSAAAMQGDARAQYGLGQMYRDGRGVPLDYVRAFMWFDLARSEGNLVAELFPR